MLKKFSLKKINSNIKVDILFLHFLIKKLADVKIVKTSNYDKDIATIFFITNSKKNSYF